MKDLISEYQDSSNNETCIGKWLAIHCLHKIRLESTYSLRFAQNDSNLFQIPRSINLDDER